MKYLFAIIFLLVISEVAHANSAPPTVLIFGEGLWTCATWDATPFNHSRGEEWIMGYWSGMNVAHSLQVGQSASREDIIKAVDQNCKTNPDELLLDSTSKIWRSMEASGQ